MSEVVRVTDSADEDPWAWAEGPAPERFGDPYTVDDGLAALQLLSETLEKAKDALSDSDSLFPDAVRYLTETLDVDSLVQTVDLMEHLRKQLGYAIEFVSRQTGQATDEVQHRRKGTMPDGRLYEVKRGYDRKAWDHEGWQSAARAAVIDGHDVIMVMDAEGELHEAGPFLNGLLRQIESVHGSTAPKVTALKLLDIDPGDYCEQYPGPYRIVFSADHVD